MKRCGQAVYVIGLLLCLLLYSSVALAATPGLPFTEDFSADNIRDDGKTTAAWNTFDGVLLLDKYRPQYGPFSATTAGADVATNTIKTADIVLGDMDGDGDLDLVEANYNNPGEQNRIYFNDGTGSFDAGTNLFALVTHTETIAVGDLDNDGDLDIVTGNWSQKNRVFFNEGSGSFFPIADVSADTNLTRSIVLFDIDGDGDLDLIEGNTDELNRTYFNNGDGSFAAGVDIDSPLGQWETYAITLADITGDNIPDLIEGNNGQESRFYPGNDNGTFGAGQIFTNDTTDLYDIIAFDADNDGDIDIVTANFDSGSNTEQLKLYPNDGSGYGTPVAGINITNGDFQPTSSVDFGDVDGDGDFDLVTGNYYDDNRLYLNNGDGTFESGTSISSGGASGTLRAVLGDIDNDGDLDVVAGNYLGANRLYKNKSSMNPFSDIVGSDMGVLAGDSYSVVVGDIDNDGLVDAIVSNNNSTSQLYTNLGSGTFNETNILATVSGRAALGDVDNDGDLDIVKGGGLYVNTGGTFAYNSAASTGHRPTLADVNGDGWLDLLTANTSNAINTVSLNDGVGVFLAPINITTDANSTQEMVAGDLDNDGDLDVIAINEGQENRFYLNDGSGSFGAGTDVGPNTLFDYDGELGDVDGDGDLDLIVGGANGVALHRNNGGSFFREAIYLLGRGDSLDFEDFDYDGDLDILIGGSFLGGSEYRSRIILNNGDGTFYPAWDDASFDPEFNVSSDNIYRTEAQAVADFDNDGYLDLVTGNWSARTRLYLSNGRPVSFSASTGFNITSDWHYANTNALGDVDNDGDLDLVIGRGMTGGPPTAYPSRIYKNNGAGDPFNGVTGSDVGDANSITRSVVLADMNEDGYLDLLEGNYASGGFISEDRFFPGDGTGNFGAGSSNISADTLGTESLAVADIDMDGHLDVIAGAFGNNFYYLGNGSGGFSAGVLIGPPPSGDDNYHTVALAVGDVNGDGALDLVTGELDYINRLYLNSKLASVFPTGSDITTDNVQTNGIALGDMDNDGDLDIVAGNAGINRVYINDGNPSPSFVGSDISTDSHSTREIILNDVDHDGDLDVIAINYDNTNTVASRLYLNDGTGLSFIGVDISEKNLRGVAGSLGDLDRDGSVDLVLTQYNALPSKLYRRRMYNTARFKAQSLEVDARTANINNATLTPTWLPLPDNTSVDYFMSNNGGVKFFKVVPDTKFDFPTTGADLRWKAELKSLSPIFTPVIQFISILTTNSAPVIAQGTSIDAPVMDEDGSPTGWTAPPTLISATDVDLDTLTWSVFSQAGNGTATVSGTGTSPSTFDYVPNPDWNGSDNFVVQVSDGFAADTITVNITVDPVNDPPNNTALPTVSGTHHVGQLLSANNGNWNDLTDVTPGTLTLTYKWHRADDGSGTNAEVIPGAINSTYSVQAADNGKFLQVEVIATDDGEGLPATQATSALSDWTQVTNVAPVIAQGTSIDAPVMDEDGSPTGWTAPPTLISATDVDLDTLTWSVFSQAGNGTATVSGTGTSPSTFDYVPNPDWNGSDNFVVQVSDGFAADTITVNITVDPINDPPNNTAPPVVSGTHHVGQVLTVNNGTWNDNTDLTPGVPLSYSYMWYRADDGSGINAVVIAGEINSTYLVQLADNGKFIQAKVTASDNGEGLPATQATSALSTWTQVANAAPVIAQGSLVNTPAMDKNGYPIPWTAPTTTVTATDADGIDTLTWSVSSLASNGAATVNGSGSSPAIFTYVPNLGFTGGDSFEVQVADSLGGIDTISVYVTVDQTYGLTATKAGSGSGTVTSSSGVINCGLVCSDTYTDNTLITLTATPDAGSLFISWTGNCDPSGDVIMDGGKTCTATFVPEFYNVNATAGANGSISPPGYIPVEYGTNKTFTITSDADYYISDVLVDSSSVGRVPSYTFTNVTSTHSIAASFAEIIAPFAPVAAGGFVDEMIIGDTTLEITSSPFDDPDADIHAKTNWRARRADLPLGFVAGYDPSFDVVFNVDDAGGDTGLTYHLLEGLAPGLRYIWQVSYEDDTGGISPWSDEYAFLVGTEEINALSGIIPPGINMKDYLMISFVHWPADPSSEAVLGDEIGEYDPVYFRFGGYDTTLGGYTEYGPGLDIVPGRAYWVLARQGLDILTDGVPVSLLHDIDVRLDYNGLSSNGWNMVAPPNDALYNWADVEIVVYDSEGAVVAGPTAIGDLAEPNSYIDTRLWRWESGAYESDTVVIMPHQGYWVRAKQANVSLRFPVGAQLAQARPFSPVQMFVRRLQKGIYRLKKMLVPAKAVAEDGDTPPLPMGVLAAENSAAPGGGSGGCFIAAASQSLAEFSAEGKAMRIVTRVVLTPLVYMVAYPFAALFALLLFAAVGSGLVIRKRRNT